MVITTKAIVFSALKYSEADLIVCCYTQTDGVKSYLLRGILKSKRGRLRTSYFQPLTQLEIVANHKNKGTLENIKEAKVSDPYKTLHTDVVKSGLVLFISEMLKNVIQEEEGNLELFEYLTNTINWLDDHNDVANFHILFLLKLTAFLGFYPDASSVDGQYFNLLEGNFQQDKTNKYCEESRAVEGFKQFFGINFDTIHTLKIPKKERLEVLNLILMYYQLHLQGFKKPKSLLVLNQLFN